LNELIDYFDNGYMGCDAYILDRSINTGLCQHRHHCASYAMTGTVCCDAGRAVRTIAMKEMIVTTNAISKLS